MIGIRDKNTHGYGVLAAQLMGTVQILNNFVMMFKLAQV